MADEKKVRQGAEVSQEGAEDLAKRRAAGGEITSNGVFTKVLRDGEVQIVPTSEIYSEEAEDRVEGVKVEDQTVTGPTMGGLRGGALQDKLEREFNTQQLGDTVSKRHAQGAAGTIAREESGEVKREEGAYEDEAPKRQAAADGSSSEGDEDSEGENGEFDPSNPSATTLTDLPAALEGMSDEDVKKAQKADKRSGAKAIYEQRLSGE